MRRARLFLFLLAIVVPAVPAVAQTTDVVAQARALEKSGQRADAIDMLRARLAVAPGDDDAREMLGLYLSWEGMYDEARTLLQLVVDHRPGDADVLAGLMNVELWSGHPQAAKTLAERGVSQWRGDGRFTQGRARALRAMGVALPWTMSAAHTHDSFSDSRQAWRETQMSLKRDTPVGAAVATVIRAERLGLKDTQYEVDLYPKFRPGTYAYVSVGVAPDKLLFPHIRTGADLYQSVGNGFEISAGFRRLEFSTPTMIYVGAVNKYVGNWLLTGRIYYVPNRTAPSSKSYNGSFRRYFGGDGTSYIGGRYSRGFAREEIVSINDFEVLSSDTVAGDADIAIARRWRLTLQASSSRQDRMSNPSLRQNTLAGGLSFLF